MSIMRAKMRLTSVTPGTASEAFKFTAVCGQAPFGKEGESEDNTYARWTPTATLDMQVTNPALLGKFKEGQTFYVDFTPADLPQAESLDAKA